MVLRENDENGVIEMNNEIKEEPGDEWGLENISCRLCTSGMSYRELSDLHSNRARH